MHTLIFANPVLFLSTLSLRRATLHNAVHSLARNFYPRSPCGERQFSLGPVSSGDKFLSTLSLRRATAGCSRALIVAVISIHALLAESDFKLYQQGAGYTISIHALLAESDQYWATRARAAQLFLSTLSLRRATAKVHKTVGHFCAYGTNFMGISSSCCQARLYFTLSAPVFFIFSGAKEPGIL